MSIEGFIKKQSENEGALPEHERFRGIAKVRVATLVASFVFFLKAVDGAEAFARVQCIEHPSSETLEFAIQRNDEEPNHKIRFVDAEELSRSSSPSFDVTTALYQDLAKQNKPLAGINYAVEDVHAFKKELIPLIDLAKNELGLTWRSMSEMSPRDLIFTSAWIVSDKLRFDYCIAKRSRTREVFQTNSSYDIALAQKVADQPFDVKLMKGGIGVCRDFTSEVTFVSKAIKEVAQSKACEFIHVVDLDSPHDYHAINAIFELKNEGGTPIVTISFIDTSISSDALEKEKFIVSILGSTRGRYQKVGMTGESYIAPILSEEDKRHLLKCLIDYNEQGVLNLSVLEAIMRSYFYSERTLSLAGKSDEAKELNHETTNYYRTLLPRALLELERAERMAQRYQKVKALTILEKFYEYLVEQEKRIEILNKIYLALDWSDKEKGEFNVYYITMYADELGKKGETEAAIQTYDRMFLDYQEYLLAGGKPYEFKRFVYDVQRGSFLEIEPLASREQFDQYVQDKYKEWEQEQRRRE